MVSGGKDPFDALADYDDTPTHIMVIRSPAILERALAAAGLRNRSLEEVEQRLKVTRPDPTVKILEIGYQAATSEEAIKIVDAIVASYKKFLEDNYQKSTADVITLIAKVRDQLNEELEDLERKYLDFHRQHPTFAVGANGRSLLVRRLDQWDAAANESMMRAVKLQAQLDLARELEKQGAGLATIGTTLRYLGDEKEEIRLAGLREGARIAPSKRVSSSPTSSVSAGRPSGCSNIFAPGKRPCPRRSRSRSLRSSTHSSPTLTWPGSVISFPPPRAGAMGSSGWSGTPGIPP